MTEITGGGEQVQVIKTKFGNITCQSLTLEGVQVGIENEDKSWTSTHTTFHPTYSECRVLGIKATVSTAGCNYTFTPPTKTDTTGGPHAQLDIVPSGEAFCTIKFEAEKGLCTIWIWQQTSAGLVDFMNEGSGSAREITIDSTMDSIEYGGVACFCNGEGETGDYYGQMKLKGSSGGAPVGIWVTNT